MHQNVRAFFNCCARRFQFGRVNRHADLMGVTFFNRGANGRPETVDRMILVDDVPDLHQIGFLLGEFAHELARLLGTVDLHDRRIAKIEFLAGDAGN